MTDSIKASPAKRHVGLAFAATGLALVMALGAPLQASAASSELWNGNSAKGSWVSGRADVSTKIRVYAQASAFTQRVGVRVNGSVTNGTTAATVSYKKKTDPSIWCRWDQGRKAVLPILCTNYW